MSKQLQDAQRTVKLLRARPFQTVEDLRRGFHELFRLYNEQWLVERQEFLTPPQTQ